MILGLPDDWHDVVERARGAMWIRFVLQPLTAAVFAIRSGIRDAREGREPYGWAVIRGSSDRKAMLLHGWREVRRVLVAAIAVDLIHQALVLDQFRPAQAVLLGIVLAIVPYLIFRGVINRIRRWWLHRPAGGI
jgi:hypothetical protein